MKIITLLAILFTLCVVTLADNSFVTVNTKLGAVRGRNVNGINVHLGIPYAAPPVGKLRWQPTQPAPKYNGILDATQYKPGCPQDCEMPPHTCPETQSEDCLVLNVFARDGLKNAPVMVYIHGGNFRQGGIGTELYNGTSLATRAPVVIVLLQYRLGALGFLATPSKSIAGNFGIDDQRMAFKWVQENIASFGGNPNNVTLFGQSAGAQSIAYHLTSKPSFPYYQRAIMESNPWTLIMKSPHNYGYLTDRFMFDLGCGLHDLECARSKSMEEIVDAQVKARKYLSVTHPLYAFEPYTPIIDADNANAIPDQPFNLFKKGAFNRDAAIVNGNVANETLLFIYLGFKTPVSKVKEWAFLADIFGGVVNAARIAIEYPNSKFDHNNRLNMAFLSTHWMMQCSTRAIGRYVNEFSNVKEPFHTYLFDHRLSFSVPSWGPNFTFCDDYICHGEELVMVFDTPRPYFTFTPAEQGLADEMGTYWTNFALSGSPNEPVTPNAEWKATGADDASQQIRFVTGGSFMEQQEVAKYCDFWDELGYIFDGPFGEAKTENIALIDRK